MPILIKKIEIVDIRKEQTIYDSEDLDELLDEDLITSEEAGFMSGYI